MKFFSTLFFALLTAATLHGQVQPIYRLSNMLWQNYDTATFRPYANVSFHYSGNRQGIFSNPDEVERLLTQPFLIDSLLQPIPGLQYDTALYLQFGQNPYDKWLAAQNMDNTGQIQYHTLYNWNPLKNRYEQQRQDMLLYNAGHLWRHTRAHAGDTTIYYRNSTGLPDSIEYRHLGQKQLFFYNAAGDLAEKTIVTPTGTLAHIYYKYDLIHRVQYIINLRGINDTAQAMYYVYNSVGDLESDMEKISIAPQYPLTNNTWKMHRYDAQHNRVQTEIALAGNKHPDIWDYELKLDYLYNSYGFIDTAILHSYNKHAVPAGWVPIRRFIFHYELAWPVSIATQSANTATIQLYPNPAGEILTFHIGMETAQPFTASIADMQGRVLMQWKEAAAKEYTRTIPTAALPTGTYVLRVEGEGLEQTKLFSVK